MSESFCNRCGHKNPADANFCSSCGAALIGHHGDLTVTFHSNDAAGEVHEPDVTVHIDDFGDGPGVLVVKRGADAGTTYTLANSRTVIGRGPDSDIFLDDVTVSRLHAEVLRLPEGYVLKDGGSLNGTYVNRERIAETVLVSGDEVQIGKFRLVFLVDLGD